MKTDRHTLATTESSPVVDPEALRAEVRTKYAEVATHPDGKFHFHTGRALANMLGYPKHICDTMPDSAMASFAGVDNPFAAGPIHPGSRVVDLGSGGGFDCFVAAGLVGPTGSVIGVDMTPEMLDRARREAALLGLGNVEFRSGILEQLPVDDGWADVVIANGVLNLVADKVQALQEARRVLRPGGILQFADIAVGRDVPRAARCDIELWTDCIAGGLSIDTPTLLIQGTHGADDPEKATLPFIVGNVAATADQDTVVFLTSEAVRLATHGYADDITFATHPATGKILADFVANGGRVWACGACTGPRGITADDLIDGATIVTAANLVEAVTDGAKTIGF